MSDPVRGLVRKPLYPAAMHRNVELLIGRLATNPGLTRRFAERPREVLHEQGLELTEVELTALAATDPDAFRAFAAALDARLRRVSPAVESRPSSGDPDERTETTHHLENER